MGFMAEHGWENGYADAMDNVIETALPDHIVEALDERKQDHTESYAEVLEREFRVGAYEGTPRDGDGFEVQDDR